MCPHDRTEPTEPTEPARWSEDPKQLAKDIAKAELVSRVGGERYELPAVVDRAGTVLPVSLELAAQVLTRYAADLTVDVEHTGYPIGHKLYRLKTVQLGGPDLAVVLDPHDGYQALLIEEVLGRAERLHAHSAAADLVPLEQAELLTHGAEEAWTRMHDTVIPLKLTSPSTTQNGDGLKELAARHFPDQAVAPAADKARAELFKAGKWLTEVKPSTSVERSGWAQVDSTCRTMLVYAASDVLDTALLAQQAPEVPPALLDRERAAERLTARVSHRGLPLDRELVETKHAAVTELKRASANRLAERWGVANGASSKQVMDAAQRIEFPIGTNRKTGRPSMAAGVLEPYQMTEGAWGDFARDVLDHREQVNRLGLFMDPYRQLVRNGDGRARPIIYTLGADTGRMSCARPNLQQVPREGGFRACLTADEGHLLVSADFSGVELRVAAALSQDPDLFAIVNDPDRDLHWEVTRMVFGPEATKAHRYATKRGVFGWLYGGGPDTLAAHMGAPRDRAVAMIDALTHMLPRTVEWSREVKAFVQGGGREFPTYSGRIVLLDPDAPHKAPNYAIQGVARELLIDGMFRWDAAVTEHAPYLQMTKPIILPVHDEVLTMAPAHRAEEATTLLVQCMTSELYGVPIKAEPSKPSFAWQDSV